MNYYDPQGDRPPTLFVQIVSWISIIAVLCTLLALVLKTAGRL